MLWHDVFNFFGPLNKAVFIAEEIVLVAKVVGFLKVFYAIEVEVENPSGSRCVLVDYGECRARDDVGGAKLP